MDAAEISRDAPAYRYPASLMASARATPLATQWGRGTGYSMVWHGLAWHGRVWHGMVWYSCIWALISLGPGAYAPFLSVSSAAARLDAPFLISEKGLDECKTSPFTPKVVKSSLGSPDRPFHTCL
jgi:hypothetical protein